MANDNAAFLDAAFERLFEDWMDGRATAEKELIAQRPALRSEIEDLSRSVRLVAVLGSMRRTQIAGYELIETLGCGAMGTVFLARQSNLGRIVALKTLPRHALNSARAKKRFRRESHTLAKLRHENIVTVFEALETDEVAAYAMEWIDGPTLASVMKGRKPIHWYCRCTIALARALSVVHQAGLVHRDISPRNILLRQDGTPVICDFGLVRDVDSLRTTQPGEFLGTAAYAAPEQLQGDQEAVGPASDQFALAMVLAEALRGAHPLEDARTLGEISRRIEDGIDLSTKGNAAERIPRDLITVLTKALSTSPKDRYGDMGAFADDLQRVLQFETIKAQPPARWRRVLRAARRHRTALVAAATSALLVVAVTVGLRASQQRERRRRAQVREELENAHLALIHPRIGYQLFRVYAGGDVGGITPVDLDLSEASSCYARAKALAPKNELVNLESEILSWALFSHQNPGSFPQVSPILRQLCPNTVNFLLRSRKDTASTLALKAMSQPDRYALGLYAYLTADFETCVNAWAGLDLSARPSPLVDAVIGEFFLALQRPARAFPRLLSAARALPRAGHLLADAADAACGMGDFEVAEQLMVEAEAVKRQGPFQTLARVHTDLLVAQGEFKEALALYQKHKFAGPGAQTRHAVLLHRLGRHAEAVEIELRLAASAPRLSACHTLLREGARLWWDALDPAERQAEVVRTLARPEHGTLLGRLVEDATWQFDAGTRKFSRFATPSATDLPPHEHEGPLADLVLTREILKMNRQDPSRFPSFFHPALARLALFADQSGRAAIVAPFLRAWAMTYSASRRILTSSALAWALVTGVTAQVQSVQKITTGVGGFATQLTTDDGFGVDFAPLGDLNGDGKPDFIVPAYLFNALPSQQQIGALFVISLNPDGTVFSESLITAAQIGFSSTGADGYVHMGLSVECLGDLDGDGNVELVVGAHWFQGNAASPNFPDGAIAIVSIDSSFALVSSHIISEGLSGFLGPLDDGDFFGAQVANLGDVDGDGTTDLAVAAYGDDDGGTDRGAIYILFLNTNGTVASYQKISDLSGMLAAGTLHDGDFFGYVARLGDLDGNGVPDVAVGAHGDDTGGTDRGAVHILFLDSSGMVMSQSKIADGVGNFQEMLQDSDRFCRAKGGIDVDGDGIDELTVGAFGDNGIGASYVLFLNPDGTVRSSVKIGSDLAILNGLLAANDNAGYSSRLVPDLNGDNLPDLLFSAHLDDSVATNAGAFYVLFLDALFTPDLAYPGSNEDVELLTGINAAPCTTGGGEDLKTAATGDFLSICLDTPNGTFLGETFIILGSLDTAGSSLLPGPLPDLWLPIPGAFVLVNGTLPTPLGFAQVLVPSGLTFGAQIPLALQGQQIAIQTIVPSTAAINGQWAWTEAHVISIP